jgi:hypothetical protein
LTQESFLPLIVRLQSHVSQLGSTQRERDGGKLLIECLEVLRKNISRQAAQHKPENWQPMAIAWLRGKAADQARINDAYPRHATAYPSWTARVENAQRLADELEREHAKGAAA